MDLHTENRGRPHQKERFPAAPVMGRRNFLPPPEIRTKKFTIFMCSFFSLSLGNENWTQTFFSQTFRAPPGYPGKVPGYPAQKVWFPWFRGTYRTFWPPPVHVEDPYPTGKYPDQKVWVWVPFSSLRVVGITFVLPRCSGARVRNICQKFGPKSLIFFVVFFSVALPAEPRGEKKLFFVQLLGGEKLLKFGEKWAVKHF